MLAGIEAAEQQHLSGRLQPGRALCDSLLIVSVAYSERALLLLSVAICLLILVDMIIDVFPSFTKLTTGIGQFWMLIADNEVSLFYRDQSGGLNLVVHRLGPNDANAPEIFFEFNRTHVKIPGLEFAAGTYAKSINRGFAIGVSYWVILIVLILVSAWAFCSLRRSYETLSSNASSPEI